MFAGTAGARMPALRLLYIGEVIDAVGPKADELLRVVAGVPIEGAARQVRNPLRCLEGERPE